ncbi:MAG: PqqD family protein [Actinomycetota bacterium]|nr:PqqD family protein [Actinomycetota bacterium]
MAPEPDSSLLQTRVRVPEHVVYRDFGDETVILNLDSGMYHGLNRTAAAMVERLGESDTVGAAVDRLSADFEQPRERIERDVLDLCRELGERGLIERDGG